MKNSNVKTHGRASQREKGRASQEKKEKKMVTYLDPKADLTFKKVFGEHKRLVKSLLNAAKAYVRQSKQGNAGGRLFSGRNRPDYRGVRWRLSFEDIAAGRVVEFDSLDKAFEYLKN